MRQQGEMKAGAQLVLFLRHLGPQPTVHVEGDFSRFNVLSLETEES